MFNTLLFKLPQMYAMHGNRNSLTSCPEGMSEFVTTHLTLDHGSELFTVTALISLLWEQESMQYNHGEKNRASEDPESFPVTSALLLVMLLEIILLLCIINTEKIVKMTQLSN